MLSYLKHIVVFAIGVDLILNVTITKVLQEQLFIADKVIYEIGFSFKN